MARRIVLGTFLDGGCGLRVSRPGYDADENPAKNDHLSFNSDWTSMLPIWEVGNFSVPANNASPVAHSFANGSPGFIPFFLATFSAGALTTASANNPYITATSSSIIWQLTGALSSGGTVYYVVYNVRAF